MKIGFQIDPIERLNLKTDSSLPLILESQKRKNKNFCFSPNNQHKNNRLYARAREITFRNKELKNYILGEEKQVLEVHFHYVFIR